MSERERYPAGVPCWVETLQPDVKAALAFYGQLFNWEFVGPGTMPGDPPGQYFVARLRDRDVAGIGSLPNQSAGNSAVWSTYVRVDSADAATKTATGAGGRLLAGPFDATPAGRFAVLSDPVGAIFCVWEAKCREGAQLVNEPRAWAMSLLHSSDPEQSKTFYGELFGWHPEPFGAPEAQVTLWRLPGYVGGEPQQPVARDVVGGMVPIAGDSSSGATQAHWSVDFWIDDADAAAVKASQLGGKIVVPPFDIPNFRTAVLADPNGASFSVSQLTARF